MSSGIDYPLEETVHLLFTTRAFATGIPGTLSAATVAVYEDGTATPIMTAVAVTEDLNSIVGLNMVPIVATTGNGFNAGASYHVVIEAGTVDSVSVVGEVVGSFSIGRSTAAVDLANATDGLGALKTLIDTVNTDLSNGTDGLGALKTLIDTVNTDLSNATDGLGALKTLIDAVKAETALIVADTNELQVDDVPGLIAALNDIATSDVLTQVNAALDTAISELGVAAPTATPTLRTGLMLLYMALRNKTIVQTSGTDALEIHNDAGTKIAAKLLTDDGSDYTEAEMA